MDEFYLDSLQFIITITIAGLGYYITKKIIWKQFVKSNNLSDEEVEVYKNLRSSDPLKAINGSNNLLKLNTYNLAPFLDEIGDSLPKGSKPAISDYRERVRLHFKLYKYYADGKNHNCDFYEKYGFYFWPESDLDKQFLTYVGVGKVDLENFISEKLYKCKVCGVIWATNENIGWHVPFMEWRRVESSEANTIIPDENFSRSSVQARDTTPSVSA